MDIYKISKEKEQLLIDKIVSELDTNRFKLEKISETCEADLVVFDNVKYKYYCAEIKSRVDKRYTLDFFKREGMACETSKLEALMNKFCVFELTLFTITSDNYIIKSKINFKNEKKIVYANKTTAFSNKKKVRKEFYVCRDFEIVYMLNNNKIEKYNDFSKLNSILAQLKK